ncbi:hypothetical protein BBJ28_00020398 [Nothophytophthora sp. Chile5]|nr:hypothetical protein BBJ28_00020398 [Nothophytophthora sp. Chile5]
MPHEETHVCWASSASCVFLPLESGVPAAELTVNTTLAPQLATVELSIRLQDPNAISIDDLVAIYLVDQQEEGDAKLDDFVDYVYVNQSRSVDPETRVIALGPLVNMRASYQFRYLRQVTSSGDNEPRPTFVVLGESPYVEMERGHTEPLQIRLALTDRADEMRVSWGSGRVFGANVRFGTATSGQLERRAEATTVTYDASDMCDAPATTRSSVFFRHPGYLHDAVMTALVPGERYIYRVGSVTGVESPELSFTFPSALGDRDPDVHRPQSFFVFGDLGISVLEPQLKTEDGGPERQFTARDQVSRLSRWGDERSVMRRIQQDLEESLEANDDDRRPEYAAVVHVGDVAYAKGSTYLWDQLGALVAPVASQLAYMVCVGNHEYDYTAHGAGHDPSGSEAALTSGWHPIGGNFGDDSHGECGVPFARRFHMPEGDGEAQGNPPFWYSFSMGLTHHVVLSSEHRCSSEAPMRLWLEQELATRVDRSRTPWLIVHLHRPLYCSEDYAGDHAVAALLRGCLEDLLAANRVDLVFSGHYHAYERTCPVFREECREQDERANAPTHIMVGSGGAELDDVDYLPANWSRSRQQEYGYGRLHVFNASHARFEFLRARDRVVSDAVWIVSSHDWDVEG